MDQETYAAERGCRNSGMALGGIGAGSLEIRPDGCFYNWYLMNNRPWGAGPATDSMDRYGLRFALCFDGGQGRRLLALEMHHGLDPKVDGWFWMSDPYHVPWVEHPTAIRYQARIPAAQLDYEAEEMPLKVSLRAWSPFIPHQAQDSNTPAAILTFTITNPTDRACDLGLMGLMKNAVGYDRPELVSRIDLVEGAHSGLVFGRLGLGPQAASAGTMGLFVRSSAPLAISHAIHPRHGRDLFDPLLRTGRLENTDYAGQAQTLGEIGAERKADGPKGMQRGALCAHATVEAGASIQITFYLTWHFPNFWEIEHRNAPAKLIGVQYANRFNSALAVAQWLQREEQRLLAESLRFSEALYASTLPPWELDAIAAGFSVLQRACWWDASGRFGIWEGLGCCGMQTIDVGHYASFPVLQFFPQLDASQNSLSAANLEKSGKVPHLMPGNFSCSDSDGHRGRIDLGAQYTLAVWRHALWTGDLAHARSVWPVIERNMTLLAESDTDGDGLPNNQGPDQTYDRFPLFGTSAYVGFLYLAALRAAGDLGEWLGNADLANWYRALAEKAAVQLEKQLWNGSYYNLSHDSVPGTTNTGCMTDQLNGDWFLRQSAGTGLLADERARSALEAVYRHNRRTAGPAAWLANCTWPQGGEVQIARVGSDQANCPWSGVEYAVAAHMVLLGLREKGRRVAEDVFRRYESAGMRFDHVECGEFYYRAMSAWALYLAEFGIAYNGLAQRLAVWPPAGDALFVVAAPTGLATAQWTDGASELRLRGLSGQIPLRALRVRGRDVNVEPVVLSAGGELRMAVPRGCCGAP